MGVRGIPKERILSRLHVPSFEFDPLVRAERRGIAIEVFLDIFGQVSDEREAGSELALLLRRLADWLEVRG